MRLIYLIIAAKLTIFEQSGFFAGGRPVVPFPMPHVLLNGSPSAISDTVEVLDDVREYYPSERLIYLSALNYPGIPWKRIKKFDQAFFYKNQVVNALKDKKAKDLAS